MYQVDAVKFSSFMKNNRIIINFQQVNKFLNMNLKKGLLNSNNVINVLSNLPLN